MSLRWRIAAALAAVAAVVGVLVATGAYLSTADQLQSSIDESLVTRASELNSEHPERGGRDGPGDGPGGPSATTSCPQEESLRPASAAQLVAPDGTVMACLPGAPALPTADAAAAMAGGKSRLATVTVGSDHYRMLTTRWRDGGALQLGRDLSESDSVLSTLRLRLAGIIGAGVIMAALLGWLIARRMVRPIIRLRNTAETIATTQDLRTPIPNGGGGEVGSLSQSFTTMVSALGTSREQQERLITDASHEMRTPLTSLTNNIALLDHLERLPAEELREIRAALRVDVSELTHLLTELVELATDSTSEDEPAEPIRLGDVARDITQRAQRRSGRSISCGDGAGGVVMARPHMLERAISNLLENAVKYSPGGSPIEVTVSGGRLEVRDHGAGIAPEDEPFVFDRFYRAVAVRAEPGSGLGLAIVKQIVARHGGVVFVRNAPGGGAVVGFELPSPAEAR